MDRFVEKDTLFKTDIAHSTEKAKLTDSKIPKLIEKKVSESPNQVNNSRELDLIMQKAEKLRESMGYSLGATQTLLKNFSLGEEAIPSI